MEAGSVADNWTSIICQPGSSAVYANNRRSNWQYDNDGNAVSAPSETGMTNRGFTFDADGQNTVIERPVGASPSPSCSQNHSKTKLYADGDGQVTIMHDDVKQFCGATTFSSDEIEYNLKSTVLGENVVFQLKTMNKWGSGFGTYVATLKDTRIFLHGKLFASLNWNSADAQGWTPQFFWHHVDPMATTVGTSQLQTQPGDYQWIAANLDPMGADVGFEPPEEPEPPPPSTGQQWEFGSAEQTEWIEVDGISGPAGHFPPGMIAAASRCPNNKCGPIKTGHGWEWWTAFADGYEGYMPAGARYAGRGMWTFGKDDKKKTKPTLQTVSKKEQIRRKAERQRLGLDTDPDSERDFFPLDVNGIRRGIGLVWANADCKNLINSMFGAIATRSNPVESNGDLTVLFERLMTQGGISRRPPPDGQIRGGSISGRFASGNATVHIPSLNKNGTLHNQLIYDIKSAVNELMHLAGRNRYTDRAFARIVRDNPVWANSTSRDNHFTNPQIYPDDVPGLTDAQKDLLKSDNVPYSGYWHPVVDNLCLNKLNFGSL